MKPQPITPKPFLLATLLLFGIYVPAKNPEAIFNSDPLLLDNKPVNYAGFSIASKGMLTVVTGNPETNDIEKIPFRIYLRRSGQIVSSGASDTTRSLLTIDVASVLAVAKTGDYLVIEPTRQSDAIARRSIKLNDYFFNFNLFLFTKNKDGC